MARRFVFWSFLAAVLLAPSRGAAQTPITIAWDRNPEQAVLGYRVYVGTTPSVYGEVFEAGNQTQFTYPNGVAGRRYYFAVSAYTAGPLEGPRSPEITTVVAGPSGGGSTGGGSTGGGSTSGGSTGGSTGGGSTGGGSSSGGGGGGPIPAPAPVPVPQEPVGPAVLLQPAAVAGGAVHLAWSPVGGLNAAEYLLEAGSMPGASNLYNASVGAVTTLSATVGTGTYFVRVRGRAFDGTTTAPSNEVSFSVGVEGSAACTAPPAAPATVTGANSAGQATVRWAPSPGATSYLVQAGSTPGTSDIFYGNVGASTIASAAVHPGFTAYVRVVAVNGCGQSAASTEIFLQ